MNVIAPVLQFVLIYVFYILVWVGSWISWDIVESAKALAMARAALDNIELAVIRKLNRQVKIWAMYEKSL